MVEGFAERPMSSPLVNLRGVQALLSKTSLRDQPVTRWLFAAALLALSFAVRYLLDDRLPVGFPYLTFFPAVIITSFFAGVLPGVAVAFVAGLFSWYFFIPPFDSFALTGGSTLALSFYVFIVAVDILLIHWMQLALDRLEIEKESAARHADERDLLFRELQHRVSNNLAVVSSLLNAQSRGTDSSEASSVLQQASARIALISKIQRELHDPGRQSLDLGPYLTQLGPDLLEASGVTNIRYEVDAEAVEVSAELAVPLGLIATELISNSIEHGCADGRAGRIVVELRRESVGAEKRETPLCLTVSDDGPGWPEGFSVSSSRNLGMRIVASLAEQIGGVFEISNADGAVSTLRFATRGDLAD